MKIEEAKLIVLGMGFGVLLTTVMPNYGLLVYLTLTIYVNRRDLRRAISKVLGHER